MSHYFYYYDSVMAVCGTVQAVNSIGSDSQCCIETEGGICHRYIIIYSLRHGNNIEAFLF